MILNFNMKHTLLLGGILFTLGAAAQTLDQAINLTRNEQFEKADKAFKVLLSMDAKNGAYYFYEGENFFAAENMDSAKAAYQKGITVNAAYALNYVGLGKIQWYSGDSKDAIDNFFKAKTITKSKDATVLAKTAEAYVNGPTKDIKTALDLLNQAIGLEPNNVDICLDLGDAYLAENDGTNAATYYDKATSINPKSALGTLKLGILYGRARNYDLSFQYFQKANQIDSTFAPAYRQKAEMLYSAGRYDDAIAQYKKYLQLNDALDARKRYGSFLFLAKKYADAITEMNKVMVKDTNSPILYRIIAYSQYETGNYKDGLSNINKFFVKAAKANTKILPSDYAYQGKLLSKNGQDSLAIVKMNQAISNDPNGDVADLYSQIANIYYKDANYPMAVQYARKRVQQPKATVNDYNLLGRAAYSDKEYQVADSAFGVISKYMPDLPLGYLWRAYSNSAIDSDGKQGLAKPYYDMYIQKAAKDSLKNKDGLINAYNYEAYSYIVTKDYDKAKYYYSKTAELDPNDPKAKQGIKNIGLLKNPPKKEGVK